MNACVTAAIAGFFQRGKSTLANALLGREATGRGRGLATTHSNRSFSLTPQVRIVDTPGFDSDRPEDTRTALKALEKADVFIYVHENNALGDRLDSPVFQVARDTGKSILFLLNCMDRSKWTPEAEENTAIVSDIEATLENHGFMGNILPMDKRTVVPVNVLWASFGAGLLDPASQDDRREIARIRKYACDELEIPGAAAMPEALLQAEMLRRSGIPEVREWLMDLPLWRLRNAIGNPEHTLERILARFAAELEKRWRAV